MLPASPASNKTITSHSGLNLTAADHVFIITQGTVEEKILALQRRKLALVSELIATDEAVIKHLTRADIEELLG